jgi:hypothetical protein
MISPLVYDQDALYEQGTRTLQSPRMNAALQHLSRAPHTLINHILRRASRDPNRNRSINQRVADDSKHGRCRAAHCCSRVHQMGCHADRLAHLVEYCFCHRKMMGKRVRMRIFNRSEGLRDLGGDVWKTANNPCSVCLVGRRRYKALELGARPACSDADEELAAERVGHAFLRQGRFHVQRVDAQDDNV